MECRSKGIVELDGVVTKLGWCVLAFGVDIERGEDGASSQTASRGLGGRSVIIGVVAALEDKYHAIREVDGVYRAT